MKTKTLLGLVAVVAVAGFAASAQAGWSVGVSFAAPVYYAPPVVVAAPYYAPAVAYYPPPVVHCAPPMVYAPAPYRAVVYQYPSYAPGYGYRSLVYGRPHGRGNSRHVGHGGYNRGGHR